MNTEESRGSIGALDASMQAFHYLPRLLTAAFSSVMASLLSCVTNTLPDPGYLHKQVPYAAIIHENSVSNNLYGRNVLVTGGTNGIGAAGMSLKLSSHSDIVRVQSCTQAD